MLGYHVYAIWISVVGGACATTYLFDVCGEDSQFCAVLYALGVLTMLCFVLASAERNFRRGTRVALLLDALLLLLVLALLRRRSFQHTLGLNTAVK